MDLPGDQVFTIEQSSTDHAHLLDDDAELYGATPAHGEENPVASHPDIMTTGQDTLDQPIALAIPGLGSLPNEVSQTPAQDHLHPVEDVDMLLQLSAEEAHTTKLPSRSGTNDMSNFADLEKIETASRKATHMGTADQSHPGKTEQSPGVPQEHHANHTQMVTNQNNGLNGQESHTDNASDSPAVAESSTSMQVGSDVQPDTLATGESMEHVVEEDEGGAAEWKVDSSPIESSSESSTSDDTSSEDSDEEDDDPDYAMLDPEEQARILMQGDGGSDDEGHPKGSKAGGGHIRSVNEKPEEVIPKPDIVVTPDMAIEELGAVEGSVENTILVTAKVSGEYKVLESGSVLCLQDRSVIGSVSETLGRVQQPMYTIRFTNDAAIEEAGLSAKGTTVYYVEKHSSFVFTQPMKAVKGSDASNVNDEEVGDDEMEFSDDEAEAEYKRQLKNQKRKRQEARNGVNANGHSWNSNGRSAYSADLTSSMYDDGVQINYDDVDQEDGEYTPLARPANLHEMAGRQEGPSPGWQAPSDRSTGPYRGGSGRGRGDGHHRGGRGRGRGGGRGRDRYNESSKHPRDQQGYQNPPAPRNDFSMGPPSSHPLPTMPGQSTGQPSNLGHGPSGFPQNFAVPQLQIHPSLPHTPSLTPQSSRYPMFTPSPISPLPPSQQFQFPPTYQPPQQGAAISHTGSHLNPAFFNNARPPQNSTTSNGYQTHDNNAAYVQVQQQLDMLRRFGNSQQPGNNGR